MLKYVYIAPHRDKIFTKQLLLDLHIANFTFFLVHWIYDCLVDRAVTSRFDSKPCENVDGPIRGYSRPSS